MRTFYCVFVVCMMSACARREIVGVAESAGPSVVPTNTSPAPFRAAIYTEAFAKRFSASSEGIRPLDPGLQALVVRVVQHFAEHPNCYLDLYIDDGLDVAFPPGDEGLSVRPDDENPFFFVRDEASLGPEAHRWDRMIGSFHSMACRKGPDQCKVDEQGGPIAYARHLVPGTALQTYRLLCSAFDPANGPSEMWILRRGHEQESIDPALLHADATHRFAVPHELLEYSAQRIRQAVRYYDEQPLGPEPPRGQFSVPIKP